jgi:hypothetical protein
MKKYDKAQVEIDLLKQGKRHAIGKEKLAGVSSLTTVTTQPQQTANKTSKKSNNNIYNHNNNAKLVKQYFSFEEILNDPQKTRLYIDKLNAQLDEKDNALKALSLELENKVFTAATATASNPDQKPSLYNNNNDNNYSNDSDEQTLSKNLNSEQ